MLGDNAQKFGLKVSSGAIFVSISWHESFSSIKGHHCWVVFRASVGLNLTLVEVDAFREVAHLV